MKLNNNDISAIDHVIDLLENYIHTEEANIDKARDVQIFLNDLITK